MRQLLLLVTYVLFLLPSQAKDDYSMRWDASLAKSRYRNISMNDGLAANAVRNIVQDQYGFMWFGTDNGLCRYDGVQVQLFRIADMGMNQYISALKASERGIYVGTSSGVYCYSFDKNMFERLPMDIHSEVTSISVDKEGNMWISTIGQGIWRYTQNNGQSKQYASCGTQQAVAQVLADNSNQIWALTNWEQPMLQRLNRLHDRFEAVNVSNDGGYSALRMLQTRDGRLWLGTWEHGLIQLHSDGQLEQIFSPAEANVGIHILALYQRSDDCICIGCDDGVICVNTKTRKWWRLKDELQIPPDETNDRFVYSITSDSEGGLWTGTFYGGVNYVSPIGKRFEGFSVANGLTGNVISRFCEDRHGRVWIASDDGGLMCYSPSEQRFINYPHQDYLSKRNAHALMVDGQDLWIGTYSDGVIVLDTETGNMRHYIHSNDPHSLDNYSSYAIHRDKAGNIWVGTMQGLNRYDPKTETFEHHGRIEAMIIDIDEDHEGNLWLSTEGLGLWHYQPDTKQWKTYRYADDDNHTLSSDEVHCTLVAEDGSLWVGTSGGLCNYDSKEDRFERIHLDIPSQHITGIIEDHGALWLSTERGIIRYEPSESTERETYKNVLRFSYHDGLVSEHFQPNAALRTSDGRIFFGSTSGFNTFYPYKIKVNSVIPPVYITSMSILNREEHHANGLPLDLTLTKELTLGYSDAKMVSLAFASLSYCSPEKIQYAYMMEGFDRDWNYVSNQNRATYTNLPAGTYIFRVKATNNDGIWSDKEATLKIIVQPPFWWSWYAKIFYLLLLGAIIWQYVHFRLKLAERQHQQEIERLNAEKEKEVRDARLNFFTMIAHEIRTPVSLIIGPLEKIMKKDNPSDDMKVIDRNAHRLLELVNQLLDFRKVEQATFMMHFAPQNIYELILSVSERFAPTFEQGGKHFTVDYPDTRFTAMVDKEAVTKVISNLLTNANKYTKDDVRLSCVVEPDGEHFRITVSDNGVGIREEDRKRIFDPFFQAQDNKPGTGIGLNIVKNIVDLHHGKINVESEVGKGSTFTIILPVTQREESEQPQEASSQRAQTRAERIQEQKQPQDTTPASTTQTMLIVDDSEDMVSFLSSNFKENYQVITAGDGLEALDQLAKHEVNIIISDWMMPRMDGAEFCRRVRRDPTTSHIPFVMLTAKTDDDSKVQSMDVGADTYIEKPFSVEYLKACIRNMLDIRHRLMEKFSTQPLEPVTEIASNPTDNAFLQKMNQLIEDNLSNSELNVSFLAEQLNISRSGLFAKMKTLADVTPNEMIQIMRLKKAALLLKDGRYQVGEVGYMVGFSNPSYFSKCFQKQFGITPGAFCNSGGDDAQ